MRLFARLLVTFLGMGGSFLVATPSEAAFNFGDNLTSPNNGSNGCGPPSCTQWDAALNSVNVEGTLTSPIDGVVVSFTLKKSAEPSSWTPLHLRVVRFVAGTQWQGLAASSPDVIPTSSGGLETFNVRVPISKGDYVGMEQNQMISSASAFASGGAVFGAAQGYAAPLLPSDGSPTTAQSFNLEILLQARVEPDCDNDGFGDETQDPNLTGPACSASTCGGKQATIIGTDGADQITGTPGADVIVGLGGPDMIKGGDQADVICGNGGDDVINGKSGEDLLLGDEGNDRLNGAGKNDRLFGGPGKDRLGGGFGRDSLFGGPGVDQLFGGFGKDTLRGGPGKDKQVQ